MTSALKDAVERIKNAGFDHIKVELEGDIGRDGDKDCGDCYGEGRLDCGDCDGEGCIDTGEVVGVNRQIVYEECSSCYGDGRYDCGNCDGRGSSCDFREEDDCHQYMKDYVPSEVAQRLVYSRFYEDGSVDSEFTFTIHVDHIEDVKHWINAFKSLSEDCGNNDIDVSGAGLHISVLPKHAGGSYPCEREGLNTNGINNFTENMNKLMPALFFLASADYRSRAIQYRYPRVSYDKNDCPTSAVAVCTHGNSCIEFRVFETCYDKPEAFGDYIQVIANTLKFYSDPTLTVASLGQEFGFSYGDHTARFFDTPQQLRILNATVKHIKPVDKSFKKLKAERGVNYTIKSLNLQEKKKVVQIKADYIEYKKNYEEVMSKPATDEQLLKIRHYMQNGVSREEAEREVRGNQGRLSTLSDFIRQNMKRVRYETSVAV